MGGIRGKCRLVAVVSTGIWGAMTLACATASTHSCSGEHDSAGPCRSAAQKSDASEYPRPAHTMPTMPTWRLGVGGRSSLQSTSSSGAPGCWEAARRRPMNSGAPVCMARARLSAQAGREGRQDGRRVGRERKSAADRSCKAGGDSKAERLGRQGAHPRGGHPESGAGRRVGPE